MSLIALFDVEMPEILEEIKNRNLSTHPLILMIDVAYTTIDVIAQILANHHNFQHS